MSTRKPNLSTVLLCASALLTLGGNGGCGGGPIRYCQDGICGDGPNPTICSGDCRTLALCGDGICDPDEECPDDCPFDPTCGDGSCNPDETCASCPADCGANNECGSPSEVRPSAGCGLAGDSGRQDLTVTIRGVQRTYRVQFPANYDPNEPLPLIFYFHWWGGTIDEVLSLSEPAIWEVGNASNEAAFVWPQGLAKYGFNETGWDLACDGEDMEFFDAMLSNLADSRCIDLNRVFSTGFSFGADMSVSLACCRDDTVIRAVAPASGAFDPDDPDFVCPGLAPPSMRYSYGTADPSYPLSEFKDVMMFFRSRLGCSTQYDLVSVSPCEGTWTSSGATVTCTCKSYRDCSRPVIDCEFVNMGHIAPTGWREDTWDYFMSF